jgi:hypothetical protein
LGFNIKSKSSPTMRRLAAIHTQCHEFDVASITQTSTNSKTRITPSSINKDGNNDIIRTIPFNEMLYILSASLVPKDTLDAVGFVKLQLGEKRVQYLLAVIKIQRWSRSYTKMEKKNGDKNDEETGIHKNDEEKLKENETMQPENTSATMDEIPPPLTVNTAESTESTESTKSTESTESTEITEITEITETTTPSLSFDNVRSHGDAPPPRLGPRSLSAASSTTSEGSDGINDSPKIPLHKRRSNANTHPLTGLKIQTGGDY